MYACHTSVICASAGPSIHRRILRWERDGMFVAWGMEECDVLCIFELAIFIECTLVGFWLRRHIRGHLWSCQKAKIKRCQLNHGHMPTCSVQRLECDRNVVDLNGMYQFPRWMFDGKVVPQWFVVSWSHRSSSNKERTEGRRCLPLTRPDAGVYKHKSELTW